MLGLQWGSMILKVFSNLNDSMFLRQVLHSLAFVFGSSIHKPCPEVLPEFFHGPIFYAITLSTAFFFFLHPRNTYS